MPEPAYFLINRIVNTVAVMRLSSIITCMQVSLADLEWALEEHGRCDTDDHTCIPVEPNDEFLFVRKEKKE